MAEYYPLISRAVAGLRDGAPAQRQAIYGRARQALVGQLRNMQPPIPEEAIDKEVKALDEAIDRIEAELAPPKSVSDLASAAVEAALLFDAPPPPVAEAGATATVALKPPVTRPAAQPPARPEPPAVPRPELPAVSRPELPPALRSEPPVARPERPVFTPRPSLPQARNARPEAPPTSGPAPLAVDRASEPSSALPAAPTLDAVTTPPERAPALEPSPKQPMPDLGETDATPAIDAPLGELRGRDDAGRPAMPRQTARPPRNGRIWIVALAALATVIVIALTAWRLRDRPEELVRAPTPAPQVDSTPGKIVERADGTVVGGAEDEPVEAQQGAATPPSASTTPSTPQAVLPVPAPSAGTATQPASDQAIPVSYKAAVLVAAPDTPEKVKTYVGTVVWRAESTNAGRDQQVTTAVRADIDVPDAKMQMTMEIRKNTEAQFPASHTIDIKFTPGAGSPMGNVKQIDVPQMRREDAATGDPLVGVPVTITNNYFLVGLTRGDAEARNVEAMRSRGWFDIPMVLEDGKPAKITFEKGASGDRILADALAAWGRP